MDTTHPFWVNDGSPLPAPGNYTLDTGPNTFKAQVRESETGIKSLFAEVYADTGFVDRTNYVGSVSASTWKLIPVEAEADSKQPLVPGGIYALEGETGIAVSTTHVVCGSGPAFIPEEPYRLVSSPGEEGWGDYMESRIRNLEAMSSRLSTQTKYLADLREAILEKAHEMDWCSEYEAFAADWDLLPRVWEYEVEVVYRVEARSSEEAEEIFEYLEAPAEAGSPHPEVVRAARV